MFRVTKQNSIIRILASTVKKTRNRVSVSTYNATFLLKGYCTVLYHFQGRAEEEAVAAAEAMLDESKETR